jgi:hypothetical protein
MHNVQNCDSYINVSCDSYINISSQAVILIYRHRPIDLIIGLRCVSTGLYEHGEQRYIMRFCRVCSEYSEENGHIRSRSHTTGFDNSANALSSAQRENNEPR